MSTPRTDDNGPWPALPYADWKPTLTTLHMWTQIIGKVKLALTPFLTDWSNVAFALTARSLTTSTIPYGPQTFEVSLDL
jgi:Family of unknown function (DUF5996)